VKRWLDRTASVIALGALTFAWGCSGDGQTGVLGNGEFQYVCGGGPDVGCSSGDSTTDLPGAIAVPSTFEIGYAPKSSTGTIQGATGYEIVAASPLMATTSGDTVAALRAGYVALLARHVGNADVDDFVHLHFSAIRTVVANPSSLTVSRGSETTVQLGAMDALGVSLAGRLQCTWQVTAGAPGIALVGSPLGGTAQVSASGDAPSSGTVHVACGAGLLDIPIGVSGSAPADGGALGVDAASGVDAGTMDSGSASDGGTHD
jgi:hypothetical protein